MKCFRGDVMATEKYWCVTVGSNEVEKKSFFMRHLQVDLPYPQRHDRSNSNLQSEPDQKYTFGR